MDASERASRATTRRSAIAHPGYVVAFTLLAADLVLIALDFVVGPRGRSAAYPDILRLGQERGIPQLLIYVDLLAAAGIAVWLSGRMAAYRLWALCFAVVFLDDAFLLHERAEAKLAQWFPFHEWLALSVPAWVVLEPMWMAAVAFGVIAAAHWVRWRWRDHLVWRYSLGAAVLVAMFVGFAGAGDIGGHLLGRSSHLADVFEDGSEKVVATLLFAQALFQVRREREHPRVRTSATSRSG